MKILIHDFGLCFEAAVTLAAAGHDVGYFTPWARDFPKLDQYIGAGFPKIEKVESFQTALDRCDLMADFHTLTLDPTRAAQAAGKLWWSANGAESYELDRIHMKQCQEKLKLPTQPWQVITGIDALIKYLMDPKHTNKWVKSTGKHRGLTETFFHSTWETTRAQDGGQLMVDFGPIANTIEFLIEDPVGECEPGFDGVVVNSTYLSPHIIGYEDKDKSYIGHVTSVFPAPLHPITKALLPVLSSYKPKTFVSYEARIDSKGLGYLIDPTIRAPHPPFACQLEVMTNFSDIITEGARNNPIAVKAPFKYCAAVQIKSDWVENHPCQLEFPEKNRQWVKLQRCFFDKTTSTYWALPGFDNVATCVGVGNTIKAAVEKAQRVAADFKCKGMHYDEASLDNLMNVKIPDGVKNYSIPFGDDVKTV